MRKGLLYLFMFASGAAAGSVATWKLLKDKYEKIAQEEIESVKETFKATFTPSDDVEEEPSEEETSSYTELANSYLSHSNNTVYTPQPEPSVDEPYVISPDEFGEMDDYECITLYYYADKVLADDRDEIVDHANEVVGTEFHEHFGDYGYDEDSVFVRNDSMKCDYEILLDGRNFSEVSN